MDVINDRIVDVGLNVLGYLLAGSLGMLLHSTVLKRRERRAEKMVEAAAPEQHPVANRIAADSPSEGLEFVSFGADPSPKVVPAVPDTLAFPVSNHRNRRETIRLAREMLEAGTASDQIRRTLPISQSELALLRNVSSN